MIRKCRSQGSAAIEALIVVPIMLMVLVSFLFIIRIYHVNTTIQTSLERAAEDLGYYAILYKKSGILDAVGAVKVYADEQDEKFDSQVNPIIEDIKTITEKIDALATQSQFDSLRALNSYTGGDNITQVVSDYIKLVGESSDEVNEFVASLMALKSSLEGLLSKLETISKNPKELGGATIGSIEGTILRHIEMTIGNFLIVGLMKQNISEEEMERYVVGGYAGLDFKKSGYFLTDEKHKNANDIIVSYEVKVIAPINFFGEIYMVNRVLTRNWSGD